MEEELTSHNFQKREKAKEGKIVYQLMREDRPVKSCHFLLYGGRELSFTLFSMNYFM